MSATSRTTMQCHIPEESNPQHNESLGTAMATISYHGCYRLALNTAALEYLDRACHHCHNVKPS